MRRRQLLVPLLALALAGSTLPAGAEGVPAVPETEAHVDAREEYFYPSTVTVRRGGTVVWDWTGQATHNAVDATGMGLFDSGLTPPGGPSFSYTFVAAGSYRYVCTLHDGMAGRVELPVRAVDAPGGVSVAWSADAAPDGFVYDVQVKRVGRPWRSWLDGTTDLRDRYPARHGTLRFRARLRLEATGAASGWSKPDSITLD